MTNLTIKEDLLDDFYYAARGTLEAFENQFGVEGIVEQVFGINLDTTQSKEKLYVSRAGRLLSALYEYAINGYIDNNFVDGPISLVIDASDVIQLSKSENYWPSARWDQIIAMGDGRFALDEGSDVRIDKVALLANVDLRTVRNAVSSGELIAVKYEDHTFIENATARRWLHGRRGFKPTKFDSSSFEIRLEDVGSPADFARFLSEQRQRIGVEVGNEKIGVLHPSVTPQSIMQLEAGIFTLPIDTVFPIADFYQVGRKTLLERVMQIFFYNELQLLTENCSAVEVKK